MAKPPIIIFEGAELVGKSYLISQIYDVLEQQYNTSPHFLNGCNWFNADIGVFGGPYGKFCIEKYLEMAETMNNRCIIFEKFHITDMVYHELYENQKIRYNEVEERLLALGARIIECAIRPDEKLFSSRLADRLLLYPHYARIAKKPNDYIVQQNAYAHAIQASRLPHLTIDTTAITDISLSKKILAWLEDDPVR